MSRPVFIGVLCIQDGPIRGHGRFPYSHIGSCNRRDLYDTTNHILQPRTNLAPMVRPSWCRLLHESDVCCTRERLGVVASRFVHALRVKPETENAVAGECVSDTGKATCNALGGTCVVSQDGYYVVQIICFVLGLATVVGYIIPQVKKLQGQ
jgi:hypothetical protein